MAAPDDRIIRRHRRRTDDGKGFRRLIAGQRFRLPAGVDRQGGRPAVPADRGPLAGQRTLLPPVRVRACVDGDRPLGRRAVPQGAAANPPAAHRGCLQQLRDGRVADRADAHPAPLHRRGLQLDPAGGRRRPDLGRVPDVPRRPLQVLPLGQLAPPRASQGRDPRQLTPRTPGRPSNGSPSSRGRPRPTPRPR